MLGERPDSGPQSELAQPQPLVVVSSSTINLTTECVRLRRAMDYGQARRFEVSADPDSLGLARCAVRWAARRAGSRRGHSTSNSCLSSQGHGSCTFTPALRRRRNWSADIAADPDDALRKAVEGARIALLAARNSKAARLAGADSSIRPKTGRAFHCPQSHASSNPWAQVDAMSIRGPYSAVRAGRVTDLIGDQAISRRWRRLWPRPHGRRQSSAFPRPTRRAATRMA